MVEWGDQPRVEFEKRIKTEKIERLFAQNDKCRLKKASFARQTKDAVIGTGDRA